MISSRSRPSDGRRRERVQQVDRLVLPVNLWNVEQKLKNPGASRVFPCSTQSGTKRGTTKKVNPLVEQIPKKSIESEVKRKYGY